jgi:hypothetical protein
MPWLHASGYPPASEHVGYPVSVLTGGTDTAIVSLRIEAQVTGWRSACECGWRGELFYPRSEWPSLTGRAPTAIDGWETDTGMFAEWSRHLARAVPGLVLHDLARQLADTVESVEGAVRSARLAGVSWRRIGQATGMSAIQAAQCWGERTPRSRAAAPSSRGSRQQRHDSSVATPGPLDSRRRVGRVAGS